MLRLGFCAASAEIHLGYAASAEIRRSIKKVELPKKDIVGGKVGVPKKDRTS